ncbi:MAG: hypothetical protein ACJ73S_17225 [Mycobacteriales bacterium]
MSPWRHAGRAGAPPPDDGGDRTGAALLPLVLLLGASRHHRPDPPTSPSHSPSPVQACAGQGGIGPDDPRVSGPGGVPGRYGRLVRSDPTDCPTTPAPTPSPGTYRLT